MDAITGTIDSVARLVGKNEHCSSFLVKEVVFSSLVIAIWETFHPESKNHVMVFFIQAGNASGGRF